MNKKEAAEFLAVSTRAIERYVAKGKLAVTYTKDAAGRALAVFNASDLEKLKSELQHPGYQPRPTSAGINQAPTPSDKPARRSTQAVVSKTLVEFADLVGASVGKQILAAQHPHHLVPLSDKLTLSLSEASWLSGLSRRFLRQAIREGKLKGAKRGRGWNVKRADLDSYVQEL